MGEPGMFHFQQEMLRSLQEMLHVLQEMLHVLQEMLHFLQEMLHIQHGMFRCKQEMGLFLPGMLRSKQGKPPFQGRAVAAAPPLNNGLRGNAALPVIRWPSASGGRPQGPRWGERPRELLYFSFYPKPSTINFQPSTDFSHRWTQMNHRFQHSGFSVSDFPPTPNSQLPTFNPQLFLASANFPAHTPRNGDSFVSSQD
jgi:hypothetical protein